jgi:hypothetical protein
MKSLISITLSLLLSGITMAQTYIAQAKPAGEKLWGYIDQNGEAITPAIYKKCFQFSVDGLAPIYESKQFIFINTSGEEIETEISGFKLIEGFIGIGGLQGYHDGMVAVIKGKKWGFLDTEGNIAIELKYDKVGIFNQGYAVANSGGDFFVLDKNGTETLIDGDDLTAIKHFSEGLAPFNNSDKKVGYVDTDGKIAIPAQYLSTGYFSDGLAWAKDVDKRSGYINQKGEWIIDPQFDATKSFDAKSGLARVKTEGKWAYVDKNGKIIHMDDTETWGDFKDGLARGKKAGKTGFYNNKGEWVIAPEYEGGRNFKNGFAAVKKGDKWGFINTKGEWVIEPKFAAVKDFEKVD